MNHNVLFCLALIFLWGCQSETAGLLPDDKPVVEGYLVAGQPVAVRVTKQIPFAADTTGQGQPIDGLSIQIRSNDQVIPLKSEGQGYYISDQAVRIAIGRTYTISFTYLGQPVTASTVIPAKPKNFRESVTEVQRQAITLGGGLGPGQGGGALGTQDPPVQLTWDNSAGDYYFVIFDNVETSPVPIISGTNVQGNTGRGNPANFLRRMRNEPTTTDNNTIQVQSFQYFGKHQIVLFHLNPDYAALYKQTSTSTQNISTPPTTITNGLGIFTGLNADTLYLNVVPK